MQKGIDHIGISVVYFCHDGQGNILLAQRSKNARDEQGRWDIGGGGVELGETIIDTLKKEIKEEYSTDVINQEFLGYRDVFRKNNDNKTHWITFDFKVLIDRAKIKIGEPHKFDNIGLFTLNNLPAPLHSQLPVFLEKYKDKL